MRLSEWRTKLLIWLNRNIAVDSWALSSPATVGQVMGFLPPMRDVDYEQVDLRTTHLSFTQEFFVLRRMSAEQTYRDLPVNTLEGQYATLAIRLLHNHLDIDPDVLELDLAPTAQPIKISEITEDAGDWLVEIVWTLQVKILVEPEDLDPGYLVTGIDLNIWRDNLADDTTDGISDPTLRRLDFKATYPRTI